MVESDFLINMTLALAAAFLGATIAARLGQSPILGYIVAGIIIGPNTPGGSGDLLAVEALADIGVILLMFAIGVQLSVRDLMRVGRIALLGGSTQVILTIGLGFAVGVALGWTWLQALFFGAVISNSSSTVLSKVLGERGEAGSVHGRVGLGWSTVQDLSTIILVVLLSALAEGNEVFIDLLWAAGLATVFLVLLVPVGARVLPFIFARVAALQNREAFILTVATVALGTAYVSSLFGLSLALGAFVAGVVVSESDLSHQILGEVEPLRDIFAGLFFVSVGMLVDPGFVFRNLPLVILTMFLIVAAKGLMVWGIAWLFRYPARQAMLIGVTLAQSAEFSFILASLGSDLDVLTPAIFSLLLAGAAASIVVAPALHSVAVPFGNWIDERASGKSPYARLPATDEDEESTLRNHTIICGYGRVGSVIGEALQRRGFPFVVIEQDLDIVAELREQGIPALLGNADNRVLLDLVALDQARVLVVAIPDGVSAQRVIDRARVINPRVNIVSRVHDIEEAVRMRERGANEAFIGELELALEMARYTLRRYGLSTVETQAIIQGFRTAQSRQPRRLQQEDE